MDSLKHYSIVPAFEIGDTVYLKTSLGSEEEKKGSILWLEIHPGGALRYAARWDVDEIHTYYDFELSSTNYPKELADE